MRSIIDIDIHEGVPMDFFLECLEEPYRFEVAKYGPRMLYSGIRHEYGGWRKDTVAEDGALLGGVDPDFTMADHMDKLPIRYGILTHNNSGCVAGMPDPDYAAAYCRAINDATMKYWIPRDERFLMTAMIPLQDPQAAAREIDRTAPHPRVVAAGVCATAHRIPLGHRFYWPIYEAAARHNLPLHIHPSTTSGIANHSSLPTGVATNYLQWHVALPVFYMSDTVSLVLEGTFERFPNLRVALVEGGISWLVHLLWRMDKEYKSLRQEAPLLKRLPSAYIRDHIKLGTQPMEEPDHVDQLIQIFNMIDADHTVMYASDYPHFDFDPPQVLPKKLGEATLQRILHDNACDFFDLPREDAIAPADAAVGTA